MFGKKDKEPKEIKKNWYTDRYQSVVVQRNILAVVTLFSLLCSIAATFSISQLAPLKSVDPFVIQVDQKSGLTQVVDPLKSRELIGNEALNRYFIVQYVRARESFFESLRSNLYNANQVRVFSPEDTYRQYLGEISVNNPDSPASRLGASGTREIKIVSIAQDKRYTGPENGKRYFVRFQVTEKSAAVSTGPRVMWKMAIIEFSYTSLDLTLEDRYLNPIGFRVYGYRVEDDNITQ